MGMVMLGLQAHINVGLLYLVPCWGHTKDDHFVKSFLGFCYNQKMCSCIQQGPSYGLL